MVHIPFDKKNSITLIIDNKKLLVLDLDETLIHTYYKSNMIGNLELYPPELKGKKEVVHINIRPYCLEFLEQFY